MADEIRRMEDYTASDINDNIAEVREARGEYDTLADRLDNIEGGSPSPSNPIASNCVSPMTGYSKSSSSTPGNISTSDTLNAAIGKLEKRTELNENNISFNTNNGVKNLCKPNVSADSEVTYTVNADNSITVTCNTTALREVHIFTDLSGLTDGKDYILSGCNGGNYSNTYGFAVRTSGGTGKAFESDGETTFTKTAEMVKMDLIIRSGQNWTKTFYPMIRPAYISDPTYQPYALSNAELTAGVSNWDSYDCLDQTHPNDIDINNSELTVYHNAFLKRVVISCKIKFLLQRTSASTALLIGNMANIPNYTKLIPLNSVREFVSTSDYDAFIAKNATNYAIAFAVNSGTLAANTEIRAQFEYTYF